jgi:DNA polymerase IV
MRQILHMDMDAFFAAVEEKRRPELAGKPIVIGGDGNPHKRGVVATASYEARKYGIHSTMPLKTAYKLCPHAVFLPVDYETYRRVSGKFKKILRSFSPVLEDVGIDEVFLDLSDLDKSVEETAREIKRRIREETGLTCSIGIAPNKLLAKTASDMEKPDGLTLLSGNDIEHRIWPLSVRKLWGVGPKTEAHLKNMGIEIIGGIASLSLDELIHEFGSSYGRYLYEASRGMDDSPLVTHWEPKSVSRETTYEKDVNNWQIIAKTVADLSREVACDMKNQGYRSRTVTLKIRFSDFETRTRSITVDKQTDLPDKIRKTAFECLKKIELKKKVRLVGVRASNLEKAFYE